jgi:hypothetical protein
VTGNPPPVGVTTNVACQRCVTRHADHRPGDSWTARERRYDPAYTRFYALTTRGGFQGTLKGRATTHFAGRYHCHTGARPTTTGRHRLATRAGRRGASRPETAGFAGSIRWGPERCGRHTWPDLRFYPCPRSRRHRPLVTSTHGPRGPAKDHTRPWAAVRDFQLPSIGGRGQPASSHWQRPPAVNLDRWPPPRRVQRRGVYDRRVGTGLASRSPARAGRCTSRTCWCKPAAGTPRAATGDIVRRVGAQTSVSARR